MKISSALRLVSRRYTSFFLFMRTQGTQIISILQSENQRLKKKLQKAIETPQHFRVEHIKHNDKLVLFYTGFASFIVFSIFSRFLAQ